ncbi:MAG: hypothetical protein K8Q91_02300 [Candidatus Vogelbacteria bacterium]|nr:hypothetical protein [Candidatus Vogelbacteria bacterium]
MWSIFRLFRRQKKSHYIDPDEIFLDSRNLPSFNTQQFEGRIESPISKRAIYFLGLFFLVVGLIFTYRVGVIQVVRGQEFAKRSDDNKLNHTPIFPDRGIVYDRKGVELIWNDNGRKYLPKEGFGHLLGFVGYPTDNQIKEFKYNPKQPVGRDGVEEFFNNDLSGEPGLKIEEVDAKGQIESDHVVKESLPGRSINLSVDAVVQEGLYKSIKDLAIAQNFKGGAGVIMDLKTGEVLALTSYPEYEPNIIVEGKDEAKIRGYGIDPGNPFLNRAISGRYTPGSTVKPILAMGALAEKIVSPNKFFQTNGKLTLPNPYDPERPTIFPDNADHGSVDMRKAIAVSSNVYFYIIGGGFRDQKGLGIYNIEKYMRLFGLGEKTGINLGGEVDGIIPNPEWKEETFKGEQWRIGDTYHTAIGQYGVQVTLLQVLRAFATIATNGDVIVPTVLKQQDNYTTRPIRQLGLEEKDFKVVHEGMRMTVTDGTAQILKDSEIKLAVKSGSAEIDAGKKYVNSWLSGYWPYDNPRYAFSIVMEQGPRNVTSGAGRVMRNFVDFIKIYAPEYLDVPTV